MDCAGATRANAQASARYFEMYHSASVLTREG